MVCVVILVAIVIVSCDFRSEARGPDERVPHRRTGQPRPGTSSGLIVIHNENYYTIGKKPANLKGVYGNFGSDCNCVW